MKKILKICCVIIGFCLFFTAGFWCSERIRFLAAKDETFLIKEHINARNDDWRTTELTEEDANFLREHLFGVWRVSERLIALDEGYRYTSNFSEQGVEELKDFVIEYKEDFVRSVGYDQNTFSNPEDVFLYTEYGGNYAVNLPVYHVERDVDENEIRLNHLFAGPYNGWAQYEDFGEGKLVHVHYDLGYDVNDNPSVFSIFFLGNSIYINPDDTNTIYLDFCGLWELKKIADDSSTNGKNIFP